MPGGCVAVPNRHRSPRGGASVWQPLARRAPERAFCVRDERSCRGCLCPAGEGSPVSAEHTAEPPPAVVLMQMAQGFMVARALQAAAVLGIADLLAGGPQSAADLAAATSTNGPSLGRLLRALASRGIFRSDETGKYLNTPLSEALRGDVPGSARDYVIYAPHNGNVLAWTELDHVLRTGEPSFARANGVGFWDYLAGHPDIEGAFNRAMTAMSAETNRLVVENCDFSRLTRSSTSEAAKDDCLPPSLWRIRVQRARCWICRLPPRQPSDTSGPRASPTAPTSSPATCSRPFPRDTTHTCSSTSCTTSRTRSRSTSCASAARQ